MADTTHDERQADGLDDNGRGRRLIIRHPMWCTTERTDADRHPQWQFLGEAEQDELHRARRFQVEAADSTITLGVVQSFTTDTDGTIENVSDAVIELGLINHAVENGALDAWLPLADARKVHELLGGAIAELERGQHLDVTP